jgi:hypothetical protein
MVGLLPSPTPEEQSFRAFEFRQLAVEPRTDVSHLVFGLLPLQSELRDDLLGDVTRVARLLVWLVAFKDLPNPVGGVSHFPCLPTTQTNALNPVMARPTMSVFISRVPS